MTETPSGGGQLGKEMEIPSVVRRRTRAAGSVSLEVASAKIFLGVIPKKSGKIGLNDFSVK